MSVLFFAFLDMLCTLIFRFMLQDLHFDAIKCEFQCICSIYIYTVYEIDTDIYSLPPDFGKTA